MIYVFGMFLCQKDFFLGVRLRKMMPNSGGHSLPLFVNQSTSGYKTMHHYFLQGLLEVLAVSVFF